MPLDTVYRLINDKGAAQHPALDLIEHGDLGALIALAGASAALQDDEPTMGLVTPPSSWPPINNSTTPRKSSQNSLASPPGEGSLPALGCDPCLEYLVDMSGTSDALVSLASDVGEFGLAGPLQNLGQDVRAGMVRIQHCPVTRNRPGAPL